MARKIFLGVLSLVFLGIAGIASFELLASNSEQNGNLSRSLPANLVWGKEPITATVGMDLSSYAECPQDDALLDIVVLLDSSGSMEGDPLNNVIAGSRAFIDTLDFARHQVAVGIFNDAIISQIGLTNQKERILNSFTGLASTGGTSLEIPLAFARAELESRRRRAGSIPVVLLFSDGNAEDAFQAAEHSQAIQAFGGQVYVVGLRSKDFQQEPLEALASHPSTLHVAPSSAELVGMFTDIAATVNSLVLREVHYVEPVNQQDLDVFVHRQGGLESSLELTATGLQLRFDAMTREQTNAFQGFAYQITPKRYGFIGTTDDQSTLTLAACSANNVEETLESGPALLVLPALPFAVGIPAALILLSGLALLIPRRTTGGKESPPPGGNVVEQFRQLDLNSPLANWLHNAEDLVNEPGASAVGLTASPHLIIGLGEAGKVVLGQIAERLTGRVGDHWPENIRLLYVSLSEDDRKTPATPALPRSVEQVVFRRDINRQSLTGEHMAWARGNMTASRRQGRLALFTDLSHGKGESILWEPLGRVLSNQKNITVWILSDSFGSASGIVADLAHLIRVRVHGEIINSVRLCLATHNADWSRLSVETGKDEATFASLRELQRLQSNDETPFFYTSLQGQPELRAVHRGKLFDEIYLFDGHGEKPDETEYDISRLPAERGVLRVISNAMLALLEAPISIEFYLNEKNAQSSVSRGGQIQLEEYGSVMGCAAVRAPVEQTRRLAELRLIHSALFDPMYGFLGWGVLDDEDKQHSRSVTAPAISIEDQNAFFREVGEKFPSPEYFQQLLLAFLMRRMNESHSLRLQWAEGLLVWLEGQNLPPVPIKAVRSEIQRWLKLVSQSVSRGDMGATASGGSLSSFRFNAPPASSAFAGASTSSGTLPHLWQELWDEKQRAFPAVGENEPWQIAWTLTEERQVFRRYFGRESAQLAQRIRRRLFWYWTEQPDPQLRLLILPPAALSDPHSTGGTVGQDILRRPHFYGVGADEGGVLLHTIADSVRPYSQSLRQESGALATMLQSTEVQLRLDQNASPLYAQLERGKESIATSYRRYLLMPNSVSQKLDYVSATHRLVGGDPTICFLLHAQHTVRFGNMRSYTEARSAYQSSPDTFVFLAEQEAARRERAARSWAGRNQTLLLSPEGTALLERSADIFDQVGKLFVRGELELSRDANGWTISGQRQELVPLFGAAKDLLGKLGTVSSTAPLVSDIRQTLQDRSRVQSKRARLQTQVSEVAGSETPAERDVAILIAWALENPE